MVTKLNNAPPIRSGWKLGEYDAFVADCAARSAAAKARWLAIHEEASRTPRERVERLVRRIFGQG